MSSFAENRNRIQLPVREISPNVLLITGIAGFIFLIFLTAFHQQPPLFDEPYFVENVKLFEQHGLSREFLVNMQDQAPGPLYEFVHIALKPLTGLQTPGIRLVNVFLLGLTVLLLVGITRKSQVLKGNAANTAAIALIAVPMVWQVAGMALTEMPAMFFCMLSIYLLVSTIRIEKKSLVAGIFLSLFGGLTLGLAILGRSPFLLICFCLPYLLLDQMGNSARWRTILIFMISALGISLPVFFIWGGLVPPQQAGISVGYSLWHGILAFAYAALFTVLLAPRWFYFNRRILAGLVLTYLALLALNFFVLRYEYEPLNNTLRKILPVYFMDEIYPMLISPLLGTVSLYFIGCSLFRGWQNRRDPFFVFFLICGMGLLASCFKITHLFSTRYVAQAAPFFMLLFYRYDRMTIAKWIRFLAAMFIGYLSLETYMHM